MNLLSEKYLLASAPPLPPSLQRLLRFGLDPNCRGHDMRCPLHVAAAEGFFHVTKLLLEHGADPWVRDRQGQLPVDEARRMGSKPMVALLRDYMKQRGSGKEGLAKGEVGEEGRRFGFHLEVVFVIVKGGCNVEG